MHINFEYIISMRLSCGCVLTHIILVIDLVSLWADVEAETGGEGHRDYFLTRGPKFLSAAVLYQLSTYASTNICSKVTRM